MEGETGCSGVDEYVVVVVEVTLEGVLPFRRMVGRGRLDRSKEGNGPAITRRRAPAQSRSHTDRMIHGLGGFEGVYGAFQARTVERGIAREWDKQPTTTSNTCIYFPHTTQPP